ncbi:MAG: NAD-dependent epimerase/dehydratase family protein [Solirubrobacteraceae bacterium]
MMEAMRILLTGISGFAGSALLPRLLEEGHEVRALARDRGRVERTLEAMASPIGGSIGLEDFELTIGDTLSGNGMLGALRGVEVAYYLIHSMEPSPGGPDGDSFPARERASAQTFAHAARTAGVRRIVYLGGPLPGGSPPGGPLPGGSPPDGPLPSGSLPKFPKSGALAESGHISPHLSSRNAVERILLDSVPDSVALRASIVIGARSRSFRFLVRLVERMPVLALPAWRRFRSRPIDERDIVEMLAACASVEAVGGRSLDAGGPEILTYGEIVERIADLMMLARPSFGIRLTVTPIAARLAAVIADERPELVLPLMESLTGDLLPRGEDPADLLGVDLHSFDSAVEHALGEWERSEELAAR